MGRRKLPDRKPEIISKARKVFVDSEGFDNVSIASLSKEIGVSSATIYKNFNNYNSLIKQVIASCGTIEEVREVLGLGPFDSAVEHEVVFDYSEHQTANSAESQ